MADSVTLQRVGFFFVVVSCFAFATSCSLSTTSKAKLVLEMQGVFSAPESATGNGVPLYEQFTFVNFFATNRATAEQVSLYDGDAVAVRIIDRPQIVFSDDLPFTVGTVLSEIILVFETSIIAATKKKADHEISLASGTLTNPTPSEIKKGKDLQVKVGVKWKNTVTLADDGTDSVSEPEVTIFVKSD